MTHPMAPDMMANLFVPSHSSKLSTALWMAFSMGSGKI
jgi:hypothetical protein